MIQLIIGGEVMPETSHDRYSAWVEELSVSLVMAAGNMVKEMQGKVWRISYSYDFMGNAKVRRLLETLRQGGPFSVGFIPDNSDEMTTSQFFCTSLTPPTFAFSQNGKPMWHNLAFELREVRPHD